VVALDSPVESGALMVRGKHHLMTGGDTPTAISCRLLVNATGLYARDTWDRLVGEELRERAPPQYYARGHYFSYTGDAPFSRLVYPVPEPGGLGVHATLDMGGQVRFGPDVQWIDSIDYRFDDTRRDEFLRAIRDYFPAVDASRLQPGYTGIRPKVVGPGEAAGDFTILCAEHHGIRGFCSLHGIESPGLTAAMSIAQRVVKALLTA
jgi:D-amino-acid oxidase